MAAGLVESAGIFVVKGWRNTGVGGGVHVAGTALRTAVGETGFAGFEFELLFTDCADSDGVRHGPLLW